MKYTISILHLIPILFRLFSFLRPTASFNTFGPRTNPLFTRSKHITKLHVTVDPNDVIDQIQNIHDSANILSTSTSTAITYPTTLVSFFEKVVTQPQSVESLINMKAAGVSSITADKIAAAGPKFEVLNASPGDFSSPKLSPEQMDYYAHELDVFSKLPLAAAIYVVFDFFFFNAMSVRDEEMYIYDEESYLQGGGNKDTPEKITAFIAQNVIRLVAALAITYATVLTSKWTYHPHF